MFVCYGSQTSDRTPIVEPKTDCFKFENKTENQGFWTPSMTATKLFESEQLMIAEYFCGKVKERFQ